jgi:REP element-mobilizing transposase RayT
MVLMPRQLRGEYTGAIYHVLNRGDRREDIFRDAQDRRMFLDTLTEACAKTHWQIHAYCLMRNHFHLVLETPAAHLVAGMKWLLGLHVRTEMASQKIAAYLGVYWKWAGPGQVQGVLNKNDLLEIGGEDGLRVVLEMIEAWHS